MFSFFPKFIYFFIFFSTSSRSMCVWIDLFFFFVFFYINLFDSKCLSFIYYIINKVFL